MSSFHNDDLINMCNDLVQSLNATHALYQHCIVNKNYCQRLDEKVLGILQVLQRNKREPFTFSARSYHILNSLLLRVNSFYQKSSHKSWTNTFNKHAIQVEFNELIRELDDLCCDEPELTPVTDPILVKIKSSLHLSQNSRNSTPTRRGSVALSESETESVESTLDALRTGLQNKSESFISLALGNIARLSTGSHTRQREYSSHGACDLICTCLRLYPSHRTIGEHGALSLYNLCQISENIQIICDSGGPEALILILSSNSENVALIREVCHTVDYLCLHDKSRQKFLDHNLTMILFQSLQSQSHSAEICEVCLSTIYELGYEGIPSPFDPSHPNPHSHIHNICELLLKIYSNHLDTQILIRYITWIIINLAIEPNNHSILREMDIFQCIIKCLVKYHVDEEICESCLGSIIYLCQNSSINQTAFSYYDISYALGLLLETHLHLPPTSFSSSSSAAVASTATTGEEEEQPILSVPSVELSPTSTFIAEMVCIAIIQLTSADHFENIINLGIPSICRGLVAVIQLKYLQENGPALLREAYGAIRNLCHSNLSNTILLESFTGSDQILETLEKYYEVMDPDFILTGITALYSLLRHKHANILDHFIHKNGFNLLYKIQKRYLSNEIITENLILILSHLLFSFFSHDTSFIESSLLSLPLFHSMALNCLELYPSNEVIVENCYLVICDVIQRNDCSNNPINEWNETSKCIQRTLQQCYEFEMICSLGCFILDSLLSRYFENNSILMDSSNNLCDFIVTTLKFHSNSFSTSLMICRFLKSLIQSASVNIILMSSCGCCEVIVSLLKDLTMTLLTTTSSSTTQPQSQSQSRLPPQQQPLSTTPFDQEKIDLVTVVCQCIQILSTKSTSLHILLRLNTISILSSLISHSSLQLITQDVSALSDDVESVQSDDEENEGIYRHAMEFQHSTLLICLQEISDLLLSLMRFQNESTTPPPPPLPSLKNEKITVHLVSKLIFYLQAEIQSSSGKLEDQKEQEFEEEEEEEEDSDTRSIENESERQDAIIQTFFQIIELDLQGPSSSSSSTSRSHQHTKEEEEGEGERRSQWHNLLMNQLIELLHPILHQHIKIIRIFQFISCYLLKTVDFKQLFSMKLKGNAKLYGLIQQLKKTEEEEKKKGEKGVRRGAGRDVREEEGEEEEEGNGDRKELIRELQKLLNV